MKVHYTSLHPYYITFGTADHFPYGVNDYVIVNAHSESEACHTFQKKYPDHTPGIYNFAFIYSEKEWNQMELASKYYKDSPADVLDSPRTFLVSIETEYDHPYPIGIATSEENARAMVLRTESENRLEGAKVTYLEMIPDSISYDKDGVMKMEYFNETGNPMFQRDFDDVQEEFEIDFS